MRYLNSCLFVVLIGLFRTGLAQGDVQSNMILSYSEKQGLFFHVYDPPLRIKADYSDISQAVNQYPEQLMQSIFSARNQAWVDYNTLGGAANSQKVGESHFQRIVALNKETNYFELIHKMSFQMGDVATALVKFYVHQEGRKPASGCAVMQFVDGRWQKTSHPSLSALSIALMRIKTDVMQAILFGGSTDPEVMALQQRVTVNGAFDLARFETEFTSWYSPSLDKRKIARFIDPQAW